MDETVSLEKRYEMLRTKLADYLLLQVNTFVAGLGDRAIGPAMEILTDKSAEIKVRDLRAGNADHGRESVIALAKNLSDSMGVTFNSDYKVEEGEYSRTVSLDRCGCIESVVKLAPTYDMTATKAKSVFCGACMGGYRKAAETLGLTFKGKLSSAGCTMSFSEK